MSLSPSDVNLYGDELYSALVELRTVPNLRDRVPGIDITDAYRIQSRMVQRRIDAGETIVGKKVGATSAAVMNMLGLDEPDFGQLCSRMLYSNGDTIKLDSLIQPRAEGEIAFVLKHDLVGPGLTAIDVLRATDYVVPCFEIVDSRIDNWDIKVVDTIADNASCGVFVLGHRAEGPVGGRPRAGRHDDRRAPAGRDHRRAVRDRSRRGGEGFAGQLGDVVGQHARRTGHPLQSG